MDERKSPKKTDGIRRHTDVRTRASSAKTSGASSAKASAAAAMHAPPYQTRSKTIHKIEHKRQALHEEEYAEPALHEIPQNTFLERSGKSVIASNSKKVIHERSFRNIVMPRQFSFLKHKYVTALLGGLGATVLMVILLSTVFARVTITLKPTVDSAKIDGTQISFDASVSDVAVSSHTVPAEFLSFDGSANEDFDATGNDYVNQKASGRVKIYNAFGTTPQALVANTRFLTDSGILFRLTKSVVIPGAKKASDGSLAAESIEADLIADKAGEESNVSGQVKLHIPGFKGTPKYDGFYGLAMSGFSGGSVGQGKTITHDDLVKAQEAVSKKVFDDLRQSMAQKIPANFTLIDSLSEIRIVSMNAPKEKMRADRFTVQVNAAARVFVFRSADVFKLLNELVLKGDTAKSIVESSADLHYQIKSINYDRKIADVNIAGSVKTKAVVNTQELTSLVAGKKEGSLIDAMKQRRDIATFRVAFFPPWMFSAPTNPNHISIVVEDATAGAK